MEKPGFTLRAVVIAVLVTLFLVASSSYIAIKMGALPWPIIFSVIVCGGIIKLLSIKGIARRKKKINIHEINVAQAGASVGGLVAAGVVFTIPGIIFLQQTKGLDISLPNPWILALVVITAGLLGVLLSVPLKKTFIDKENLPYPSGTAGAELLKLGKVGGKALLGIILIGALAAVFAMLRDINFPAGFTLTSLASVGIFLTFYPMPLAAGVGYILGSRASFSWFFGAILGWLLIVPLLVAEGFTSGNATAFVQNLGMGLVLGSGIGFFVVYVIPRIKSIFGPVLRAKEWYMKFLPLLSVAALLMLYLAGVPILAAIIAVVGVWIMVAVAARMTGETNIDPLEQFGILIGLVAALVFSIFLLELSIFASFMIVVFVSVACAVAGDIGHDYKSAKIIGTRFKDIVKIDLIAVVFAGLAAPFVFELVRKGFSEQLFTPLMPAPQAQLVAGSIFGFAYPYVFLVGFGIAFLAEVINTTILPKQYKNKLLIMPLGIGLFLGLAIAIPLAIGAIIRAVIDKNYKHLYHAGLLVAAGIMGGEGIAGFTAGALTTAGLNYTTGATVLIVVFAVIALISILFYLLKNKTILKKARFF